MGTMTYQPSAIAIAFPDAPTETEAQNAAYEKNLEEIHSILRRAAIEYVMSTISLPGNTRNQAPEQTAAKEGL